MLQPEAVELLDRKYEFVTQTKDSREFVVRLIQFLDLVATDVRLRSVVEDCQSHQREGLRVRKREGQPSIYAIADCEQVSTYMLETTTKQ